MGEMKVGQSVEVEGTIELISRIKHFGNNKRINVKLKGADAGWISLVSSRERVEKFKKDYVPGNRMKARCKVHQGRDPTGKPRMELWVQEISRVREVRAVEKEATLEVDQYFIDQLKRAEHLARKAGMLTRNGEKYSGIVAATFEKISRHEFYIE